MPRFPRPEMAARLDPLLCSQGVTGDRPAADGCASSPTYSTPSEGGTGLGLGDAGARPAPALLSREEDLGLRLANAIAAAVYGPRGELREK